MTLDKQLKQVKDVFIQVEHGESHLVQIPVTLFRKYPNPH